MSIVLVTGAGSGIGRAVAVELTRRGHSVVVTGRRLEPLRETVELCGDKAVPSVADVGQPEDVDRLIAEIEAQFGRLDVLFNNAGANVSGKPIDELSAADLTSVVQSNLLGSLYCARGAFGLMRRQSPGGGRIVNSGSVSAYGPRPNSVAYTAAKHGVTGLTKSLILDGRAFGIACSQVDIGNAATERTEKMARGVAQADGRIAAEERLDLSLVASQIAGLCELPLEANIPFLTLMPTTMPLYGRG